MNTSEASALILDNNTIQLLEQLGHLRDEGVLTHEEFDNKKRELMARI